jgi:sugar transferase EpsL
VTGAGVRAKAEARTSTGAASLAATGPVAPSPLPQAAVLAQRRSYRGKRVLDLAVLALVALPALIVGVVGALALWLDDGRPVIFRQVRAGLEGQPFVLLKLRTMRRDAMALGADQSQVTSVGRVLRRLSVDEIPQLINVLRGDMSLVGPRPTLPYQVQRYDQRQRLRLSVLPGLSGLAQVHGRQRMSWPERIEWDLCYVEHQSLRLDLAVLARTVRTVLTGTGATANHDGDPIARLEGRSRNCA